MTSTWIKEEISEVIKIEDRKTVGNQVYNFSEAHCLLLVRKIQIYGGCVSLTAEQV